MSKSLLLLPLFLIACTQADNGSSWSSVPREARVPAGEQPLLQLPDNEVIDAIGWASLEIEDQRRQGVELLIGNLGVDLADRGIDVRALGKVTADYVDSAPDLPGYNEPQQSKSDAQSRQFKLGQPGENHQYLGCPMEAPDESEGTRCDQLVEGVLVKVRQGIEQGRSAAEVAYGEDFARLSEPARRFIASWSTAARTYGADVAATYAKAELRGAGVCDDRSNPRVVAHVLGHQQGVSLVIARRQWAIQQVETCAINTDEIAEQVLMMARSQVNEYVVEHEVCADHDFSQDNNEALVALNEVRRTSILEGINDQVLVLKQALLRKRQELPCDGGDDCLAGSDAQCDVGAACDVAGCGPHGADLSACLPDGHREYVSGKCMCCRAIQRDGGRKGCRGSGWSSNIYCKERADGTMSCQCGFMPLGSPLVIDLEGDGLALTSKKVRFDLLDSGESQQATWVGAGEALLVLDLDGDGRIGSGAELFGDRSRCAGGTRCYDGVEALRHWDALARGGNRDGQIDARDRVYSRLRLWVDADQDGVSSAAELSTLAERGVVALALDADYRAERRDEGSISARLRVTTKQGPRTAYDVWFKLDLQPSQLRSFLPPPPR